MKSKVLAIIVSTALIVLLSGMAMAAPSFLGTTGNILTPNDQTLPVGDFTVNMHALDLENSATILSANVGLTDEIEVGIGHYEPNGNVSGNTFLNAKYSVLKETASMPALTVGLVDATGSLDTKGDPGFYLVLGKNLTRVASDMAGEPVGGLRGYVGVGGGLYSGVFLAADYTLSPKAHVIAEFINELNIENGLNEKSVFNAGIRFSITDRLTGDLALINGEDLGFGLSYINAAF